MTEDNMNEEAVMPQEDQAEPIEQIMDEAQAEPAQEEIDHEETHGKPTMIPLSVAQKLREQKKEKELENQWLRQQNAELLAKQQQSAQPVEDNSRYESATKEDLSNSQAEAIRVIEEKIWIRQNPEKYERVNLELSTFLKQRPNLARAISEAGNRYEEAYTLMDALSAREQKVIQKKAVEVKKPAPDSPSSVPKGAQLNEAVDVMSMSDSEFAAWRKSKKQRR